MSIGSENFIDIVALVEMAVEPAVGKVLTTKDVILFTLPSGGEIISCFMNVDIDFTGTTSYNISIGSNGAKIGLLTAQDVMTTGLKSTKGTDFTTNRAIYSLTDTTSIQARATADINTSNSTAGKITFYFLYIIHR